MPTELDPSKVTTAVEQGFERMSNARQARIMFLRQFVGQYYDAARGNIGTEPLNLIFNAIRVLVPTLVYNFPVHNVGTPYMAHRDYGDMLGAALTQQDKKIAIRDTYRRWIVDAIFMMGITKTGLCDSGTAIPFQDGMIDPGTVYTDVVDFDNFVFDPNARRIEDALFIGDRMRVSRQALLESGLYKNELIERLPRANEGYLGEERADQLSARNINFQETGELEDEVEICELWVPRAKALVTVPACGGGYKADDYLRVADYYGPDDGPYTFLRFTPPVPNNPLPISMVGIWYDLHVMANKMAKKIMEQADRQKDIVGYRRSATDDAQEALDATDGEAIAMDDPDGIKVHSFGGQQRSNEAHVQQLQVWFNMMAGNPEGMAGLSMNSKSATEANMLQGNAQIGQDDMKDLVYAACAQEARKRAWYLHTDPLIEVPLTRRVRTPAQYGENPANPAQPLIISPSVEREIQVFLTPEARCGEFLDFTFTIEPDSMGRIDSQKRLMRALDFATKIIPSAASAAQTCTMMGVPFSFQRFVVHMAKEHGITWMDEVFQDPEFQQKLMMMMARGPQEGQSKGSVQGGQAAIMQNGQPGNVMAGSMTPQEQFNSQAQAGAPAAQGGY